jgi:transcriptional regulator with XRE-family HTH domain
MMPPEQPAPTTDYEALASELIRALRGNRSQVAFSRRLGRASNVVYAWESGRSFPTAAEMLRAAALRGHDLRAIFERFCAERAPSFLAEWNGRDLAEPAAVAALLRALKGSVSISELARRAGAQRTQVSRWLSGDTEPRLPDFLRMLDATARGTAAFLAGFVPLRDLPSLQAERARRDAIRAFLEHPAVYAVAVALGLEAYRKLPRHQPGWLAERLGIHPASEELALSLLRDAGAIRWDGRRWIIADDFALDARDAPEVLDAARRHFARLGAARMQGDRTGRFNYVLMTVDDEGLAELHRMQAEMFERLRAFAAAQRDVDHVVVVNLHTFEIGPEDGAAWEPVQADRAAE